MGVKYHCPLEAETRARIYHGFQAEDIIIPNPPSGDTMYCGDLLVLRADPTPNLSYQDRIEYCWQIIEAEPGPPYNGVFPGGNCVRTRENTFRADYPGDIQIHYRIKDVPTEYYSEYSNTITLHLVPKIDITRPNPPDYKFTFDAQTPDGVLKIPAKATVIPTQVIPDLVWDITPIVGSNLVIDPGPTMDTVDFVFTGLPSLNSEFGQKWVYASLPAWNTKDSVEAQVFFEKYADNHPPSQFYEPNWYYYWKQTAAFIDPQLYGGDECVGNTAGYFLHWGYSMAESYFHICHAAAGVDIQWNGIDLYGSVGLHENKHYSNWWESWCSFCPFYGQQATEDVDKDYIPKYYEINKYRLDPNKKYTHWPTSDTEWIAEQAQAEWINGSVDTLDWANPGHQY